MKNLSKNLMLNSDLFDDENIYSGVKHFLFHVVSSSIRTAWKPIASFQPLFLLVLLFNLKTATIARLDIALLRILNEFHEKK
ncbi:hypothetical protein BpHYR1_029786 [Brachionus plicatilis]|uniref:Uncharacterized protein n=1 Tax=Brachionus plicatilis TaxID=10195 RepID=A0A3M7RAX0_BRAPC|nr:hypothetical protein BpHYR1_029786 [Brachionus plicatilis]